MVQRSARVLHDGLEGWLIDDGTMTEFRPSYDRVRPFRDAS
ncbi:MAG: hypothetical protein ABI828_00050 [Actinomycetota bacterium]